MKRRLVRLASLVTPNSDEAEALTGISVTNPASARDAAKSICDMGAKAVLVKGGHFAGEPVDVLFDGVDFQEFAGRRFARSMHGTGCALSAAIAAKLALGEPLPAAVESAKSYVAAAIERSAGLGKGDMNFLV